MLQGSYKVNSDKQSTEDLVLRMACGALVDVVTAESLGEKAS